MVSPSIVSSIGVIISLSIAIAQLKKTASIAIADHSRQKQATIEFLTNLGKVRSTKKKIRKAAHDNQITEEELNNSPHLKKYISQYLSLMERMAVGIDADVFDYEVSCPTQNIND